jgi:mercuric ion binding protein
MKMILCAGLLAGALALPASAAWERYELKVAGLDCPICAQKLERALASLPSVKAVKGDLKSGRATIRAEDGTLSEKQIKQAVEEAGFVPDEVSVKHES